MDAIKKKFLINFVPTGVVPNRKITPYVPLSPEEIAEEVIQMSKLGVHIVHLHARDYVTQAPTYKGEVFSEIIEGIRRKNEKLIICVSTSGRIFPEFEKRAEVLDLKGDLKPDFASLTLSSLNFNNQESINSPEMIKALLKKMKENGIRPELEVFDLGMINYAHYLIDKGWIKPPYYFNLILGNISSAQANLLTVGTMAKMLPENSVWSIGGIGKYQLLANTIGLIAGDGVRVGLEDNVWYDENRTRLASNRELIERILAIAASLERRPFSTKEARRLLGI